MNPVLDPILLILAKAGGRPGAVTVMRCVTGASSDPTTRPGSRRGYGPMLSLLPCPSQIFNFASGIEVLSAFSYSLLPGSRLGSQGFPIRTQSMVVVLGRLPSTTKKKEVKARGADLKRKSCLLREGIDKITCCTDSNTKVRCLKQSNGRDREYLKSQSALAW